MIWSTQTDCICEKISCISMSCHVLQVSVLFYIRVKVSMSMFHTLQLLVPSSNNNWIMNSNLVVYNIDVLDYWRMLLLIPTRRVLNATFSSVLKSHIFTTMIELSPIFWCCFDIFRKYSTVALLMLTVLDLSNWTRSFLVSLLRKMDNLFQKS